MKTCTKQRRTGIQWTLKTQLEDLDFANDLTLVPQPSTGAEKDN